MFPIALAALLSTFGPAVPNAPEHSVRFDPSPLMKIGVGDALPAEFDAVGARGLRVVRRSEVGEGASRAFHLKLEHPIMPSRHASLLVRDGRVTGAFYPGGSLRTSLTGIEAGLSGTASEDAASDLPCGHRDELIAPAVGNGEGGVAGTPCSDGTVVDLLVLYTGAAALQAGGVPQMEDWILWAVEDSNAIYADSGIDLSIRLVGTAVAANYFEQAAMVDDLYALTYTDDGLLDEVLPLRDSLHADLVALVRADGGGACGIAWLAGADPSQQGYGYSVTALGCFTNRTFTHELGHNMGCCHAPGDGGGCTAGGVFPYSVGHRFLGTDGAQYRTVMAYSPGTRIPHFSSPLVAYAGTPTGIADSVDNARSINITRFAFTQYRCAPCGGDLNGDGTRDGADLAILLSGWGTNAPDLDGDGLVGGADLAVLLGAWGACP